MRAIITWQRVTKSEVELTEDDLADMTAKGIDHEDGLAIAKYIREQDWLGEELEHTWFEADVPEILDIEPQGDDGTLL